MVYLRTGENSAVSFPMWFYVFAVLPVQVMWLFAKLLVYAFAALAVGTFIVGRWAWRMRHSAALNERHALPR